MPNWTTVCAVEDIPVLGSRRVTRDKGAAVAIFRNTENQVFALLDRCPHKGGPLSQGIVFGTSVSCPLHNFVIGLDDGRAKEPDEGCTPKFALQVVDGKVQLDADELATLGTELALPVAGPCASKGAVGGGQVYDVQTPHTA
ncbi:MAG: nitrite reductase small subunit NirD [Aquabacterium sp.]|jgi:nitrite reductase (NADH) small subunit|nr:MAG: nitrite reductase small subunit NirD [Aquabacterium sp.]